MTFISKDYFVLKHCSTNAAVGLKGRFYINEYVKERNILLVTSDFF